MYICFYLLYQNNTTIGWPRSCHDNSVCVIVIGSTAVTWSEYIDLRMCSNMADLWFTWGILGIFSMLYQESLQNIRYMKLVKWLCIKSSRKRTIIPMTEASLMWKSVTPPNCVEGSYLFSCCWQQAFRERGSKLCVITSNYGRWTWYYWQCVWICKRLVIWWRWCENHCTIKWGQIKSLILTLTVHEFNSNTE